MTLPPDRIGDKGQRFAVVGVNADTHEVEPVAYADTEDGAVKLKEAVNAWPRYRWAHIVDRYRPPVRPDYVWGEVRFVVSDFGTINYTIEKLFVNGQYAGSVGNYVVSWTAFPGTGDHISHIRTKEEAMQIVEEHAVIGEA